MVSSAEVKLKLADLIDNLADAKVEIAKFKDILPKRAAEINLLKDQLEKHGSILWETPYYLQRRMVKKMDRIASDVTIAIKS
jgi:hypothetical protein